MTRQLSYLQTAVTLLEGGGREVVGVAMGEHIMESRTPETKGGPDCAWCGGVFESIVELLDHVDDEHLSAATAEAA